jgi:uncharacterized protein (TIGR03067 family)
MGRALLAVLAAAALVAGAPRPKADLTPKAELERMQGAWNYDSQTIGGRALDKKDRDAIWIEIDGDVLIKAGAPGGRLRYQITLDPAASPKAIDLTSHHPATGKTSVHKGIYEWDGGTLRLCFDNTGKERPKEFRSPPGQDHIYVSVLKRKAK